MFPCSNESATARVGAMQTRIPSAIVRNHRRGEADDLWRRVAGRDAESMLRSTPVREADLFGLADLPPAVR